MFSWPSQPEHPGLFVTGTDTGVGKTAVACGILEALRGPGANGPAVGVCKPFATGCQKSRSGWTGEDIEALGFAGKVDTRDAAAMRRLCPQAFKMPAAPAAAAVAERRAIDFEAVSTALLELDRVNETLLIEGIGGPKVPLDPAHPRYTVAEFAADLCFPVLLVARAGLGTLSHTAMSVEVLQGAGCRVVGVVLNDVAAAAEEDPTVEANGAWIERMTGVKVLARLPRCRDLTPGQPTPAPFREALREARFDQLAACVPRISETAGW